MPIGSLAGSGMVLLDGHSLSVGSNNLSTTFSGVIQEGGTLIKAGSGTLTLTGANTQTGAQQSTPVCLSPVIEMAQPLVPAT